MLNRQKLTKHHCAPRAGRIGPKTILWANKGAFLILLIAVLGTVLTGCGKKPNKVDPPLGIEKDEFPRIYPDPSTDPEP